MSSLHSFRRQHPIRSIRPCRFDVVADFARRRLGEASPTHKVPANMDQKTIIRRARCLLRIERRWPTMTETLRFGRLALPFTRIADPNRVLDEVAEEQDRVERVSGRRLEADTLRLPYWAELWDSAVGISTWLTEHVENPSATTAPKRLDVLDLGCGMGLAGTTAAALGAKVLFADLEPPCLLLAQYNALLHSPDVTTRRLDWRTDRLGRNFDLIIGSDILYERSQWEFLDAFWRAHLAPGGSVLLGEPGRPTGDSFESWIEARGWRLRLHMQRLDERHKTIRLFQITRAE